MAMSVPTYRFPLLFCLSCYGSAQIVNGLERAGMTTSLPSSGVDAVFTGASARYIVTVEAAGARCAVPADFDQDGDLDLVVVSSSDNTVAWYERLPDGSYGTKQMISRMSNGARIVTTGDIDQDGLVDVIVASYYDHTVGWFRNTGSKAGGLFGNLNIITRSAIAAQGVSVADIDGDGDLDVLSASSGDDTVAWYENLGGGRFCEVKSVVDTNSKGVRTVIAADLDEDGHLDLAVASKNDGSITWYKNNGKQRFQKIVIDSTAKGAYSLVAEDVDKDGHLDLVTAANMEGHPDNGEGEGGMVSFYRNGAFADGQLCNFEKVRVTAGADYDWFVLSVWAGDLDGDGDTDIASASFGLLHQGGISWYENVDGSGNTWTRHRIYESLTTKTGHYIFGADMDGDGDTDLIAVTNGDNTVSILTASTACDGTPKASCCRSDQYWDAAASTCASCAAGYYLNITGDTPICRSCNSDCPRPGLAFQPAACQSISACADSSESMARCDCGADRYLDEDVGICVNCPDGHSSTNDTSRTLADYDLVERSFLDGTKYLTSDHKWRGFNASRCVLPFCEPGHRFDVSTIQCLPCPAGSFSKTGTLLECMQCPAGHFCGDASHMPTPCSVGTYTSSSGMSSCVNCSAGRYAGFLGKAACHECPTGRFAPTDGQSVCDACSTGTYASVGGASECVLCPGGFITQGEGAVSLSRCICEKGAFLQSLSNESGACGRCRWGYTTAEAGATSQEDCTTDWSQLNFYLAVVMVLVVMALPPLVGVLIQRHYKRRQANEVLMKTLSLGFRSIETLQYPMCIVPAQWFCQLDQARVAELHEGARNGGHIHYLDSLCEVERFKEAGKMILFFSYPWLSWYRSGPSALQLECMQAAAKEIGRRQDHHLALCDLYIWLDVLSIPQGNETCKKLAIDSLYGYASSADVLVAICPAARHEQTAEEVGIASYKSRVWCRVEQIAHCCCNGFQNMAYSVEPGKLVAIDEEWIRSIMYIFEGQTTCCRLKHVGFQQCDQELLVPTMLAMYSRMLHNVLESEEEDVQPLCRMMESDRDRVFPHNFTFVTENDRRVQRQLFGPLMILIKEYVLTERGRSFLAKLAARRESNGHADEDDITHVGTLMPGQEIGPVVPSARSSWTGVASVMGTRTTESGRSKDTARSKPFRLSALSARLSGTSTWNALSVAAAEVMSEEVSRRSVTSGLTRQSKRLREFHGEEYGHVLRPSAFKLIDIYQDPVVDPAPISSQKSMAPMSSKKSM
eukprot:TRINITY_DN19440_c0_g1_i5.p1 TRINITY_DN19440_c0_g1~~TRINITY_DN19440_c0_g1_i5.p1  ORF type:complete len:1252 (+),score=132.38 TRINITY_DN19440_c0_g1_i5:104-3859(+)